MFKQCPNCQNQRLIHQSDGWFCLECGQTTDAPATKQSQQPTYDPIPVPTPLETAATAEEWSPSPQPIINHHASAHSQRRLQEQVEQLEQTLEIASPIDPEHELEAPDEVRQIPNPLVDVPDIPEPDESNEPVEDTTPVRPSAFVVRATEPLQSQPALTPEAQLLADARALSSESRPQPPAATSAAQAHKQADAVLAAASQESTPRPRTNRLTLLVVSFVIIVLGVCVAWFILKPTPSTSRTIPTPVATPAPSQSPSASKEPAQRDAQRKSDLNSIAIGLEAYHKATGAYPVGTDISILAPLEKTTPPYITHINLDPASTTDSSIKYGYSSDGSAFTLSAALENAQDVDSKQGLYIVHNRLP